MKLLLGLLVWPLLWLMRKLHLGDMEMRRREQIALIARKLKASHEEQLRMTK